MRLFKVVPDQTGSSQSFKLLELSCEENVCVDEDAMRSVIEKQSEKDMNDWILDRGIYSRRKAGNNVR